eukprot:m.270010 g.270010  ORF g.270010 m.270010 type:complete len:67 (-) comp16261_c0_seq5:1404-1604(-)
MWECLNTSKFMGLLGRRTVIVVLDLVLPWIVSVTTHCLPCLRAWGLVFVHIELYDCCSTLRDERGP